MRGDISEIKRALASQCQSVCQELLPAGRVVRGEYEVGSITGEAGKSLKIRLDGSKAGLWTDFAAGKGGDLIDLWCQVRDQDLKTALDDIRSYLGIERPAFVRPVKREYVRPEKPKMVRPRNLVRDYLCEIRNLPEAVLGRYKVGDKDGAICFPFLRDGELIMYKVRDPVDGAKPKPLVGDCEKILFGWQAVDPNARSIVITEGEIDALSMAAYGHDAMSVPFGGGGGNKQDWIESEFDHLARFETIYLALDNDEPGREAVAEIAKRLGRHRCRVVQLPRKDANECLVDGVVKSDIDAAIEGAEALDPDQLSKVVDFTDRVVDLFYPPDDKPQGHVLPYQVFGQKVLFRPGEVTVWTGATGSGKSQLLSDCMVHWSNRGAKVVLASLEMAPAQTLKRMIKQISGIGGDDRRPTEAYISNCLSWLDPSLLIYNRVGKDTVSNMLEAFEYCAAAYGSDTFVIDSLMRCGIPQDDYNAQEAAMFEIVDFAIQKNVHIHLVAHTRKAGKEDKGPPDVESVKGTMEITANAFNVIGVWRDKDWEKLREEADQGKELSEAQEGYLGAGGVVVTVSKQRNGDFTGARRLHFDLDCYRYWSDQIEKGRSLPVDRSAA